uniref:Uncharacterized protein n=1 Tax=Chromera velia CCMP2878 TaxID=1169474 RepID=A0A0G4F770_9ALVE|eukprot:Cvel_15591.t1-p1 / transcript=Cvel_15591.t1 / gene=Cvel_15591 / organism=Chromera_velia_CCMP2878 / gene_product=hypothetical protein / transcript_product=hypothetical protein / location=Cvel_scaffold1159:44427-50271(+) / protein_length=949 / sequence_SO=supercontig / SO=protein_coding / is_pseudo=false
MEKSSGGKKGGRGFAEDANMATKVLSIEAEHKKQVSSLRDNLQKQQALNKKLEGKMRNEFEEIKRLRQLCESQERVLHSFKRQLDQVTEERDRLHTEEIQHHRSKGASGAHAGTFALPAYVEPRAFSPPPRLHVPPAPLSARGPLPHRDVSTQRERDRKPAHNQSAGGPTKGIRGKKTRGGKSPRGSPPKAVERLEAKLEQENSALSARLNRALASSAQRFSPSPPPPQTFRVSLLSPPRHSSSGARPHPPAREAFNQDRPPLSAREPSSAPPVPVSHPRPPSHKRPPFESVLKESHPTTAPLLHPPPERERETGLLSTPPQMNVGGGGPICSLSPTPSPQPPVAGRVEDRLLRDSPKEETETGAQRFPRSNTPHPGEPPPAARDRPKSAARPQSATLTEPRNSKIPQVAVVVTHPQTLRSCHPPSVQHTFSPARDDSGKGVRLQVESLHMKLEASKEEAHALRSSLVFSKEQSDRLQRELETSRVRYKRAIERLQQIEEMREADLEIIAALSGTEGREGRGESQKEKSSSQGALGVMGGADGRETGSRRSPLRDPRNDSGAPSVPPSPPGDAILSSNEPRTPPQRQTDASGVAGRKGKDFVVDVQTGGTEEEEGREEEQDEASNADSGTEERKAKISRDKERGPHSHRHKPARTEELPMGGSVGTSRIASSEKERTSPTRRGQKSRPSVKEKEPEGGAERLAVMRRMMMADSSSSSESPDGGREKRKGRERGGASPIFGGLGGSSVGRGGEQSAEPQQQQQQQQHRLMRETLTDLLVSKSARTEALNTDNAALRDRAVQLEKENRQLRLLLPLLQGMDRMEAEAEALKREQGIAFPPPSASEDGGGRRSISASLSRSRDLVSGQTVRERGMELMGPSRPSPARLVGRGARAQAHTHTHSRGLAPPLGSLLTSESESDWDPLEWDAFERRRRDRLKGRGAFDPGSGASL